MSLKLKKSNQIWLLSNRNHVHTTQLFYFRFILLTLSSIRSGFGFETNFQCEERGASPDFVESVKDFSRDVTFFNDRKKSNLDLSTLGLGFVNEDFFQTTFSDFKFLNLSRNNVKSLQLKFMRSFRLVENLDVSSNCLTTLGVADQEILKNLIIINFENNLIRNIHPLAFSNLTKLECINLSNNKLIRFIAESFSIRKILLCNNQLTQIVIHSEENVRKTVSLFDAQNNQIRIFQVELDIDNLILSNNKIETNEYFSIRHVYETLDLSYNRIENLNMSLFDCAANIIVNNNKINQIPDTCPPKKYNRIQRLDLSDNNISVFRYRMLLDCMPELEYINIINNNIPEVTLKLAKHLFNVNGIKSRVFRNETLGYRCVRNESSEETQDYPDICCRVLKCLGLL